MNSPLKILLAVLLLSTSGRAYSQVDTIVWAKRSSLPVPISSFQIGQFLIDSDLYIVGGWLGEAGGTFSDMVWHYHIPTETWYEMNNMPFGGASCGGSFVLNKKGYFLTARDSVSNFNCDNQFWKYDPIVDTWSQMAAFPDSPRQNSAYFVYGGMGYVGQTGGCQEVDTHFWQYNPATDQWRQVATLPATAIAGSMATATLPAIAYLLGGYDNDGDFLNDMWRYNAINNQWDSIGQMLGEPRAYGVFWGLDSMIIGGGGENGLSVWNDFYKYDISSNIWDSVVFLNFPDSAYSGAAFVWNKTAYYFGGPTDLLGNTNNIGIWSADVSKFLPDTTTGIAAIKSAVTFGLYPNPVSHEQGFSVSTSESGSISFYDALGRLLDERKLLRGTNQVKLVSDDEVVFYHATLSSGETENGKVVFIR